MPGKTVPTTNGAPMPTNGVSPKDAGTSTTVAMWDLKHAAPDAPPESSWLEYKNRDDGESVLQPDRRKLADRNDYKPGGKYRSIVKLFGHYQKQAPDDPWAMGTGWLIRPNLLVTAGHIAFDWRYGLGKATEIKAYIGYTGKDSIKNKEIVQFRKGIKIATTVGWLSSRDNKVNDVSFILLETPFTDVTPYKYSPTPKTGSLTIGVVGYPADKKKDDTQESGAEMWEEFKLTNYDLTTSETKMLDYQISTFGGNSGSPVLRQADLVSIGAHVYGGDPNSASVIGQYGNPYDAYVSAFDKDFPTVAAPAAVASIPCVTYYKVPTATAESTGGTRSTGDTESSFPTDEEGFFDFLKSAASIVAPIAGKVLQTGLPLVLGPTIGGPVGALAGVALNAAGQMAAESSFTDGTAPKANFNGVPERALLGEAALSAVLAMDPDKVQELGIHEDMKKTISVLGGPAKKLAPHVTGIIMEPALRIACDTIQKQAQPKPESGAFRVRQPLTGGVKGTGPADPATKAFLEHLMAPTMENPDIEEGWFSDLGSVISSGIAKAAPIISQVAKVGLPILIQAAASKAGGAESAFPDAPSPAVTLDGAVQRAVAGEAALQALIKVPADKLEEEGVFDFMKSVVQRIGPQVVKSAPGILKAVAPVVMDLLAGTPAPAEAPKAEVKSMMALKPASAVRPQKSFSELLLGSAPAGAVDVAAGKDLVDMTVINPDGNEDHVPFTRRAPDDF